MIPETRNKYANDKSVKWLIAQRPNGSEWKIRFLSWSPECPSLSASRVFDETPIGEMRESEFAIFRNVAGWWNKKPYRLIDCRDKTNWPIRGLEGLINSRSSRDL